MSFIQVGINSREAFGKITDGGFGSQLFIDLYYSCMQFLCGIALGRVNATKCDIDNTNEYKSTIHQVLSVIADKNPSKSLQPAVNGYDHYRVFHTLNEFVRGKCHVNGIESLGLC